MMKRETNMKGDQLQTNRKGKLLYYEDGDVIFEENSSGEEIYIIESGDVEISQLIDGKKTPIAVLKKGAFFGEMAPITDTLRSATATAIGKVELTSLSMEDMIERMKDNDLFMVMVLQRLITRLRNTTTKLRNLTFKMYSLDSDTDGQDIGVPTEAYESLQKAVGHLRDRVEEKDRQIESLNRQVKRLQLAQQENGKQRKGLFGKRRR